MYTNPISESTTTNNNQTSTGIDFNTIKTSEETNIKPVGAWSRFWAAAIEWLYATLFFMLLTVIYMTVIHDRSNSDYIALAIIFIIVAIAYYIYVIYFTATTGRTYGKDAYGLRVVKYGTLENISYTNAFLREFVKYIIWSIPILNIFNGLIIIFSSDKRGLHDKIINTQVIKVANAWPMGKQVAYIGVPLIILILLISYTTIFLRQPDITNTTLTPVVISSTPNASPPQAQQENLVKDQDVVITDIGRIVYALKKYSVANPNQPYPTTLNQLVASTSITPFLKNLPVAPNGTQYEYKVCSATSVLVYAKLFAAYKGYTGWYYVSRLNNNNDTTTYDGNKPTCNMQ